MASGGTHAGGGHRRHGGGKHHKGRRPIGVPPGKSPIPPFAADPSIEAERRAAYRGLQDTSKDTRIAIRQARQDKRTTIRDLLVKKRRGRQDLATSLRQGLQDIRFKRGTERIGYGRVQEDFTTKLGNLVRSFNTLGSRQSQQSNAQGVLDAGTTAASAAARKGNFKVARQPLDTGLQRAGVDYQRNLHLLNQSAGRLRSGTVRARHRLGQDVRHDRRLARQGFKRTRQGARLQKQRAIREQAIGNADLIQQEIWAARRSNPNANFAVPNRYKSAIRR